MLCIVTDAHIDAGTPQADEFFEMLEAISKTPHDVLFLGDIMELWFAIWRYEKDFHRQFIAWCIKEKENRKIYFIEGNHEFYATSKYRWAFTKCDENSLLLDDVFFAHGHKIQEPPWGINRWTQWLIESKLTWALSVIVPFGQAIVDWIKGMLSSKGKYSRKPFVPTERIQMWAERILKRNPNIKHLFIGHFHKSETIKLANGAECRVLPPWKDTRDVSLFNFQTNTLSTQHWKKLLT